MNEPLCEMCGRIAWNRIQSPQLKMCCENCYTISKSQLVIIDREYMVRDIFIKLDLIDHQILTSSDYFYMQDCRFHIESIKCYLRNLLGDLIDD